MTIDDTDAKFDEVLVVRSLALWSGGEHPSELAARVVWQEEPRVVWQAETVWLLNVAPPSDKIVPIAVLKMKENFNLGNFLIVSWEAADTLRIWANMKR